MGNFTFFPWNSTGYKTGTSVLQIARLFICLRNCYHLRLVQVFYSVQLITHIFCVGSFALVTKQWNMIQRFLCVIRFFSDFRHQLALPVYSSRGTSVAATELKFASTAVRAYLAKRLYYEPDRQS